MRKKQNIFLLSLTAVVLTVLSCFIGYTIKYVNSKVTESCFEELSYTAKKLADDLYRTNKMDITILKAMSGIIAESADDDNESLCKIMNSYNCAESYTAYVELLRPDNTLLDTDGSVRDVSYAFNFEEEAKKGEYTSEIKSSTLDPNAKVIRNAMPVVRNGKTVYILYGVIRLDELSKRYKTSIYDGKAYVFLLESKTGDFILDTWHKSLGNINDMKDRKMLNGFDLDKAIENMGNGIGGNLEFVSKTRGTVLNLHYEPVGVNDWTVMVTVQQQDAMKESREISTGLYTMAAVIGVVELLYMACVLYLFMRGYRHARRLGFEDGSTALKNRNAFDTFIDENRKKTFPLISCIFIDANGLHELNNRLGHDAGDVMLRNIADALKNEFKNDSIFRIGGDEFVVICENSCSEYCMDRMKNVCKKIEENNYSISFGISSNSNETGISSLVKEADIKMLKNKKDFHDNGDAENRD